ncbi:HsdM family class I SAM-dependent methyltransferase [Clostridium perfringens]|uniref:HsdM family class I SAM-dependent methyltransferase n=1 Tax=Clostridium perfringens TaxID=1502 RepID=UPI0018E42516|nr:class I SAM-dependent DNA methyltransferase [Clostridium perfringens]MBI6001208.1 SAM-dependent DNA methyltransferase [Clostridium perfringens]
MSLQEYLDNMKAMIDELKAMSASLGLANTGDEYKIIAELFTYKFLNDKLIFDFDNRDDKEDTFEDFVEFADAYTAKMKEEHLIDNLYHKQNDEDFHEQFDKVLEEISDMNKDIYSVKTAMGNKKPLFEPLSAYIRDEDKELELAKRAINILAKYKFSGIYEGGFDYFSTVFEYLIKDYNKDSGKYAEYFTPLFAGNIMADILYNDTAVKGVSLYDPSGGSGTLVLSLANKIGTNNCTIYTQDISQKSTQFLRINLILNKLSHSLSNVVEGNTLTNPQHLDGDNLKKFDYIVSNPPFKTDFSNMLETLKTDKYDRFFAGLPKVPKKDKNGMAIYETFLQHVIASLSDNGKAAVVVPTGFVSASTGISKKIKAKLVDMNWLRGAIHMPSNIFATTGTSVSIIFIDKTKEDDKVMLMDASSLGTKIKLDEGQRTILSEDEKRTIISYFKERIEKPEFSVLVSTNDIKENGYSIQAGQYVDLEEEELEFDIDERMDELKALLTQSFNESSIIDSKIKELLEGGI